MTEVITLEYCTKLGTRWELDGPLLSYREVKSYKLSDGAIEFNESKGLEELNNDN